MLKKMTPYIFILIFLYITGSFFLLGLLARGVIGLIYTASLNISIEDVLKTLKMSAVAGIILSVGAFVFNRIDIYNARKKPPTDPNE